MYSLSKIAAELRRYQCHKYELAADGGASHTKQPMKIRLAGEDLFIGWRAAALSMQSSA